MTSGLEQALKEIVSRRIANVIIDFLPPKTLYILVFCQEHKTA